MRFKVEVEIARPPVEVFERLTDVARLPDWQESAVGVDIDGPVTAGTRFRETRRFVGREFHTEVEVTACESPSRFDVQTVKSPVPLTVRHSLEPVGDVTRLHVVGDAKPGGMLRLAAGRIASRAEAEFRRDFERFKELLEST